MQQRASVIGALVLAFASAFHPAALKADAAWTIHDLDQVADAAVVTVANTANASSRTWMLMNLADALIKAGDSARAKNILKGAAADLTPPRDFMSSAMRSAIVRNLAKIGDDADARALITSGIPNNIKAELVTELAIGRVQAGNIAGARQNVEELSLLMDSSDLALVHASRLDLKRIGLALVEAGATDDALRIAKSLPDESLASPIVAGVAEKLCHASKTNAGRVLADGAAADARTAAASVQLPYLMFSPIAAASKALVACEDLASAAAFVRTAIPPNTKEVTRDALIDQLGSADLALAVSPLPRPGNLSDLFRRTELLVRTGDIADATKTMFDALKIISQDHTTPVERVGQNVALGQLVGALADHGAYDAALAGAKAMPIVSRNQYYLTILRAAVARKDTENVRKLVPIILGAFDEPAGAFQRQAGLENMILALANGGYPDEARAIFKQLSAPAQTIIPPRPLRMQPAKLAELRAALGELSAALQAANAAGPMLSAPNMAQVMGLAALQLNGRPRPTRDQVLAAILRARALLPSQVVGAKAWAYSAVARELAITGDVANALEFETKLEVEPRNVLAPPRDAALAGIAEAEIKAGDLHDALATAGQMSRGAPQWGVLLNLAAQSPGH